MILLNIGVEIRLSVDQYIETELVFLFNLLLFIDVVRIVMSNYFGAFL